MVLKPWDESLQLSGLQRERKKKRHKEIRKAMLRKTRSDTIETKRKSISRGSKALLGTERLKEIEFPDKGTLSMVVQGDGRTVPEQV